MEIPKDSLLYSQGVHYDYVDRFEYLVADPKQRVGIVRIAETFLEPGPKWFDGLFALRNRIAALFGLKTPATAPVEETVADCDRWQKGAPAGIFSVFDRSENEMILGVDDTHLDLRISLSQERSPDRAFAKITVTTAVRYNNRLGVAYFFVVKPFHRMMVPALLKRNFRRLEVQLDS